MYYFRECKDCGIVYPMPSPEDRTCQYCLNRVLDPDEWEKHLEMLRQKGEIV